MHWEDTLSVASLFLKLGAISIGGPAASIALIEQEVVRKRGWLDREHFLDLLGATNLVPGPNAVEMAIQTFCEHASYRGVPSRSQPRVIVRFFCDPVVKQGVQVQDRTRYTSYRWSLIITFDFAARACQVVSVIAFS
jgi:hypothetical protein